MPYVVIRRDPNSGHVEAIIGNPRATPRYSIPGTRVDYDTVQEAVAGQARLEAALDLAPSRSRSNTQTDLNARHRVQVAQAIRDVGGTPDQREIMAAYEPRLVPSPKVREYDLDTIPVALAATERADNGTRRPVNQGLTRNG